MALVSIFISTTHNHFGASYRAFSTATAGYVKWIFNLVVKTRLHAI